MAEYCYDYTVEGKGVFPIDMLRYDSSWPADSNSVSEIGLSFEPDFRYTTHTVELITVRSHKTWQPTTKRWNSFGWEVTKKSSVRKI